MNTPAAIPTYIVIAHQPTISHVLLLEGDSITSLTQHSALLCRAFMQGYIVALRRSGVEAIEWDEVGIPAGDAIALYVAFRDAENFDCFLNPSKPRTQPRKKARNV